MTCSPLEAVLPAFPPGSTSRTPSLSSPCCGGLLRLPTHVPLSLFNECTNTKVAHFRNRGSKGKAYGKGWENGWEKGWEKGWKECYREGREKNEDHREDLDTFLHHHNMKKKINNHNHKDRRVTKKTTKKKAYRHHDQ